MLYNQCNIGYTNLVFGFIVEKENEIQLI